eukprot:1142363-Karenia_brevis.AAC.1
MKELQQANWSKKREQGSSPDSGKSKLQLRRSSSCPHKGDEATEKTAGQSQPLTIAYANISQYGPLAKTYLQNATEETDVVVWVETKLDHQSSLQARKFARRVGRATHFTPARITSAGGKSGGVMIHPRQQLLSHSRQVDRGRIQHIRANYPWKAAVVALRRHQIAILGAYFQDSVGMNRLEHGAARAQEHWS